MALSPYVVLYTIPAVFASGLAWYGWQRRQRSGALPFSWLMAALAFWSLCHAFSVASYTLNSVSFWSQLQYAGIVAIGPSWLMFALSYAGREHWVNMPLRVGMFTLAVVTYAAVLTNSSHHLWWTSVSLDTSEPFGALDVVRGPLFWIHALISYAYLLFGIGLFIYRAIGISRFYQNQARLIIAGVVIPLLGNLVELAGINIPLADDPTPFLLLSSGLLLFYASSRYQLLDLSPIAQREVFEHMPDGVIVLDRSGVVTSLNHSARLFLLEHPKPNGLPIQDLLQNSPLAVDIGHMVASANEAQSRRINYGPLEGMHSIEVRLQPLYERQGGRAGALLMLRDMTDQVRAEYARDQRLRDVSLLHRIARMANSSVESGNVLQSIVTEIVHAFGWQRAVIGLIQPDQNTLLISADYYVVGLANMVGRRIDLSQFDAFRNLFLSTQPRRIHIDDPQIAGSLTGDAIRVLQLKTLFCLPLMSRGERLGLLFVGSQEDRPIDHDELNMLETIGKLTSETVARTQLYEAAQEASALKSAFLATVSHELRTPLTSVIGFADMLQSGLFGQLPQNAEEPLGHIQRSSQLLLRLINDVLDFSKMEAGFFTVDIYPVELEPVIQLTAGALQPQLHERGLDLFLDVPAALPLIQANSARLQQVLTNLIANAIKFTNHGSITVAVDQHETRIRLSVTDTGIGIPPDHLHLVFDAFRQIENPLTRRYGGTGLGLAICKRLVKLMGGRIGVESQVGVGSTFWCDFHVATIETLRGNMPPNEISVGAARVGEQVNHKE